MAAGGWGATVFLKIGVGQLEPHTGPVDHGAGR